jgi:hypothetical protein
MHIPITCQGIISKYTVPKNTYVWSIARRGLSEQESGQFRISYVRSTGQFHLLVRVVCG